jgi:exodeoxyribonuclease V beta subunit
MKALQPFHLERTKLEPGVTLIEASAGTGKTFTIAGIVLRLVLEHRIPIEQILTVTYTGGAT